MNLYDILRELKAELYKVNQKEKSLEVSDNSQLYYAGIIKGLQLSIGKCEQWLNNTQPKKQGKRKGK